MIRTKSVSAARLTGYFLLRPASSCAVFARCAHSWAYRLAYWRIALSLRQVVFILRRREPIYLRVANRKNRTRMAAKHARPRATPCVTAPAPAADVPTHARCAPSPRATSRNATPPAAGRHKSASPPSYSRRVLLRLHDRRDTARLLVRKIIAARADAEGAELRVAPATGRKARRSRPCSDLGARMGSFASRLSKTTRRLLGDEARTGFLHLPSSRGGSRSYFCGEAARSPVKSRTIPSAHWNAVSGAFTLGSSEYSGADQPWKGSSLRAQATLPSPRAARIHSRPVCMRLASRNGSVWHRR